MKNVKNTTKAQMLEIINQLTKENEDLKTVIKNQRPISYHKPAPKTNEYVNVENSYYKTNRAHTQAEADRYYSTDKDQLTLNQRIDAAEAKEVIETKLPSEKQLQTFINICTHYNFGKDYKLQMPTEFTLATFQKLIAQLNKAPKTDRPGKPVKPSNPADMDNYYADCHVYYKRRTQAIHKLRVLYKEHTTYIMNVFSK